VGTGDALGCVDMIARSSALFLCLALVACTESDGAESSDAGSTTTSPADDSAATTNGGSSTANPTTSGDSANETDDPTTTTDDDPSTTTGPPLDCPLELAPGWTAVPNTPLRAVAPDPETYPAIQGIEGLAAVMDDWSGGVFDTSRERLVVWGGGHGGYHGNEIYAFDVPSLAWERLTDPTPDPNLCAPTNGDGTPNARHTYNGMAYVAHADAMFASGGALSCEAGGCGDNITWAFDFASSSWTNRNAEGGQRTTQCGDVAAYDASTGIVWYFDNNYWEESTWGLWSYDYDANTWAKHNGDITYNRTAIVDSSRGLLVVVGDGEVLAYDIAGGDYTAQRWETTGGDAIVAEQAIGLALRTTTGRYVAWKGGDDVYTLDPDTRAWAVSSMPGSPPSDLPGVTNGVYGRWQYVPSCDAMVVVTHVDEDVYFWRD
jgi:hypothetical protein